MASRHKLQTLKKYTLPRRRGRHWMSPAMLTRLDGARRGLSHIRASYGKTV
jgi:hypothetical protein